jgi:RHS repeat-associated protein
MFYCIRQNGEDFFYLYDGKGNVTTVVDSSQAVVATYQYNAFGRLMHTTGTLDQPYQFSTKRYDAGTGLNYYGYRFYSPVIERWMNRDPLGEAGGINLYGFVGGDPVNFVDPWGLQTDVGTWTPIITIPVIVAPEIVIPGCILVAGVCAMSGTDGDGLIDGKDWDEFGPKDEECSEEDPCDKIKDMCIAQCSETSLPSGNNGFRFWNCVNDCLRDNGCL